MASTDEVLGLLWLRPEPDTERGRAQRRRLAERCIRIADADGLEAVTASRVSAEFADEPELAGAAFDEHVHYETDLADLVLDTLYGRIRLPEPSVGWRAALRDLSWQTWELLKKHPWLAVLIVTRPLFGPNTLAYLDRGLAALDGHGLDRRTTAMLAGQVTNLGVGPMLVLLADEASKRRLYGAALPPSDVDIHAVVGAFVGSVVASGRYPSIGAFLAEGSPHAGADETYTFALESLLDGIARRVGDA